MCCARLRRRYCCNCSNTDSTDLSENFLDWSAKDHRYAVTLLMVLLDQGGRGEGVHAYQIQRMKQ